MKINWKSLIFCFIIVYLVAFIGSIFTSVNTKGEWYESIKPKITPPNFVFPIVWNILFFMIALSLYFSWIKNKNRKKVALTFGLNFVLNIFWSVLYFGLKNPFASFVEIIFLWFSIITMIYTTWKIDKKAGWLLIPYFIWVSFAGVLNYLSMS